MTKLNMDDNEYKESFEKLISELSNGLDRVIKTLKSSIQGFSLHAGLRGQEFDDLFKVVKDLGASIETLSGSVGSRKRSADKAGILTEPSLWSFAVSTRLCLKKHKKALKDIAAPVEKLIGDVGKLFTTLKDLSAAVKDDQDKVMREDEDEDIDDDLFGHHFFQNKGKKTIVGGILSSGGYALGTELEGIRVSRSSRGNGNNNNNRGSRNTGNGGGSGGGSEGHGGGGGRNNPFEHNTPEDLMQLLVNLENRIENLEKGEGESLDHVHWENHIFHTPEDIGALFEGECNGLGKQGYQVFLFH